MLNAQPNRLPRSNTQSVTDTPVTAVTATATTVAVAVASGVGSGSGVHASHTNTATATTGTGTSSPPSSSSSRCVLSESYGAVSSEYDMIRRLIDRSAVNPSAALQHLRSYFR
jgi:hypothetical protein